MRETERFGYSAVSWLYSNSKLAVVHKLAAVAMHSDCAKGFDRLMLHLL